MKITEILLKGFSFAGTTLSLSTRTGRGHLEPHLSFLPALLPLTFPSMLNRYPQTQTTAVRSRQRTLVPSSSPPLPSSSPPVLTSPVPPYTDDKYSIRRASTDSDCSIFSHFSLTPESEAGLRAFEQEMLGTPSPSPSLSANPSKSVRRWVVFKGRAPGVYDSAWVALSEFIYTHLLIHY